MMKQLIFNPKYFTVFNLYYKSITIEDLIRKKLKDIQESKKCYVTTNSKSHVQVNPPLDVLKIV